jgi:hypothetical protein
VPLVTSMPTLTTLTTLAAFAVVTRPLKYLNFCHALR